MIAGILESAETVNAYQIKLVIETPDRGRVRLMVLETNGNPYSDQVGQRVEFALPIQVSINGLN
jgi:hypothetical protein